MSTWAGLVKKDYGSSKGFLEDTKVCVCVCVCVCVFVCIRDPMCRRERNEETEHQRNQLCFFIWVLF